MIHKRFPRLAACVVGLSAALSAFAQGEKVDLKPKFEVGQEIKYVLTQDSQGVMKRGDQEMKAAQKQNMTVSRKVATVDEKGATVELKVLRVEMTSDTPGGKVEFDSEKPADQDAGNMIAAQWRPVIGQTYTVHLALDGEITKVDVPAGLPVMNNAEAIKSSFNALFRVRQGGEMTAVGETWKQTENIPTSPGMGALTNDAELTLKSLKEENAVVSFASKVAFKEGQAPPGMEIKEGSVNGDITWNVKQGTLVKLEGKQRMNLVNGEAGMEVNGTTDVMVKRID